ncbi:hypothetical protein C8J56DRAFT_1049770 [Mycena floridula]|nr:hypothetical protein C8J56DRAFT_1049770 [Mycena floridula]
MAPVLLLFLLLKICCVRSLVLNTASSLDLALGLPFIISAISGTLLLIAQTVNPALFRFHLILELFVYHRRHRSHFTFISPRRLRALFRVPRFTIFVLGVSDRTIPMVVNQNTPVSEIYARLHRLGLLPRTPSPMSLDLFTLTRTPQHLNGQRTVGSYGLSGLSHMGHKGSPQPRETPLGQQFL